MITMLVSLVGGVVIGVLFARPNEKREQCGAYVETAWERNIYDKSGDTMMKKTERCRERCDPRCQAGSCTKHCRATDRCNGACLKEIV